MKETKQSRHSCLYASGRPASAPGAPVSPLGILRCSLPVDELKLASAGVPAGTVAASADCTLTPSPPGAPGAPGWPCAFHATGFSSDVQWPSTLPAASEVSISLTVPVARSMHAL